MAGLYSLIYERPFLAVSRSPASSSERQLWRKLTLKLKTSAAIYDPKRTLDEINSMPENGTRQTPVILLEAAITGS